MKTTLKIAAIALASLTAIQPADAAISEQKKIGQFGSPIEWKLECVKWAIYHVPEIHGLSVKMVERRDCIGHAYKNLQHEFYFVANGPDLDEAAKRVLLEALGVGAAAAAGAGLLTPSPEAGARIIAALAAGKTAFVGYLAARGLERISSQYDVRIDHRTSW
jgi:hypothetical protein